MSQEPTTDNTSGDGGIDAGNLDFDNLEHISGEVQMGVIKGKLKAANGDVLYAESSADKIVIDNAQGNASDVETEIISLRNTVSGLAGLTTLKLHSQKLGEVLEGETDPVALPASPTAGDAYYVGVAGNYGGLAGEVGDLFVYTAEGWTVLQANLTNAVIGPNGGSVNENIAVFDGTTGTLIKDSGLTKSDMTIAINLGSTLDTNKSYLAKISEDSGGNMLYNGNLISGKVGSPIVNSGDAVPVNLASNGLYFEKDAAASTTSGEDTTSGNSGS